MYFYLFAGLIDWEMNVGENIKIIFRAENRACQYQPMPSQENMNLRKDWKLKAM